MEINKRENIGWIDLLRVTACFLVVFAHCCDPFVARFDTDRPIKIGRQNPQFYEVTDGLASGEKVIISGYELFGDNEKLILNE